MTRGRSTPVSGFELTGTDGTRPAADARWVPAVVPGGVHESLLAARLIEHPFTGTNENLLAWVDEQTWWYRARFTSQPGALCFEGLDTVAEVELDGHLIGSARNQHRSHRFPVPEAGDHELLIRFPPPLQDVLPGGDVTAQVEAVRARERRVRPDDPPSPDDEVELRVRRVHLRKAIFSWGWDFAPRVPSRGVSGQVCVIHDAPRLSGLRLRSLKLDTIARTATLEVTGSAQGGGLVQIEVQAPDGAVVGSTTPAGGQFRVQLPMTDVRLWWTHDLGAPDLYRVRVLLTGDEGALEVVELQHGFRTLELDRSADPDEDARHFRFILNGHSLFARGANWVPQSMLVSSVEPSTTRDLVGLARDAGMTMLRVWGGGVYPSDAFYEACDELGVLVWQDFMFACFDYPDPEGALAREAELEAVEQVHRLRHHASLALWCGENEAQAIHELVNGDAAPGDWGWSLFNELLPRVVATHDPDTPYWPGSPWGERAGELLNGTGDGDRHAWEVWHGLDLGAGGPTSFSSRGEAMHFSRFDHDLGRFISEFGIHASPELATLTRWTAPGALALGSPALEHRIKDTPKDKGWALLEYETGLPTTLEEYVDATMACQAEGLKHGVEHYRRRQPHCSGTLVWQLNDSWPGLSWSVIDFDHVPKAGYWFLQRAYQPLLASFRIAEAGLELWVTSSRLDIAQLELVVEVGSLSGGQVERAELEVSLEPGASRPVWSRPRLPEADQVAWVSERTDQLPANRRFFAPLRSLPLASGEVSAVVEESDPTSASIRLAARGYGYLSRVMSDRPGPRFSTNYVDLRDGETCVVEVTDIPPGALLSVSSYGRSPRPIDLHS